MTGFVGAALLWCQEYVCIYTLNDYILQSKSLKNFNQYMEVPKSVLFYINDDSRVKTSSDYHLWRTSPESLPNAIELSQINQKIPPTLLTPTYEF